METKSLDIKQIRRELKLSQQELAQKCGVHFRTIQNWEKDPNSIPYIKAQFISSILDSVHKEKNECAQLQLQNSPSTLSEAPVVSKESAGQFAGKDVSFSGHNNIVGNISGNNSIGNDAALLRALDEIAEQRKEIAKQRELTQKSQEQIDRLLSLLEQERRERKE